MVVKRQRVAMLGASALLLLVGLWLRFGAATDLEPKRSSPRVVMASPAPASVIEAAAPPQELSPQPVVAHELRGELIASVTLSRERVCVGEAVEVAVELLPQAREARVAVNALTGDKVILTPMQVGAYPVIVFAHALDGLLDARRLSVEVEPCEPAARLSVSSGPVAGEDEAFRFEIDEIEGLGELAKIRWDFGDGAIHEGSAALVVEHAYWDREQDKPQSSYIVSVEAEDVAGLKASAKLHISVINDAWIVAQGGTLEVPMRRMGLPWWSRGESVVEAQLRPIKAQARVLFKEAQVVAYTCGAGGEHVTQRLSAAQLLSQQEVRGGQPTAVTLRVPAALSLGRCRWAVELYGVQDGSEEVVARIAFDLGALGEAAPLRSRARQKAAFEAMVKQHRARRGLD